MPVGLDEQSLEQHALFRAELRGLVVLAIPGFLFVLALLALPYFILGRVSEVAPSVPLVLGVWAAVLAAVVLFDATVQFPKEIAVDSERLLLFYRLRSRPRVYYRTDFTLMRAKRRTSSLLLRHPHHLVTIFRGTRRLTAVPLALGELSYRNLAAELDGKSTTIVETEE